MTRRKCSRYVTEWIVEWLPEICINNICTGIYIKKKKKSFSGRFLLWLLFLILIFLTIYFLLLTYAPEIIKKVKDSLQQFWAWLTHKEDKESDQEGKERDQEDKESDQEDSPSTAEKSNKGKSDEIVDVESKGSLGRHSDKSEEPRNFKEKQEERNDKNSEDELKNKKRNKSSKRDHENRSQPNKTKDLHKKQKKSDDELSMNEPKEVKKKSSRVINKTKETKHKSSSDEISEDVPQKRKIKRSNAFDADGTSQSDFDTNKNTKQKKKKTKFHDVNERSSAETPYPDSRSSERFSVPSESIHDRRSHPTSLKSIDDMKTSEVEEDRDTSERSPKKSDSKEGKAPNRWSWDVRSKFKDL